jgi:hypothetical protein
VCARSRGTCTPLTSGSISEDLEDSEVSLFPFSPCRHRRLLIILFCVFGYLQEHGCVVDSGSCHYRQYSVVNADSVRLGYSYLCTGSHGWWLDSTTYHGTGVLRSAARSVAALSVCLVLSSFPHCVYNWQLIFLSRGRFIGLLDGACASKSPASST